MITVVRTVTCDVCGATGATSRDDVLTKFSDGSFRKQKLDMCSVCYAKAVILTAHYNSKGQLIYAFPVVENIGIEEPVSEISG